MKAIYLIGHYEIPDPGGPEPFISRQCIQEKKQKILYSFAYFNSRYICPFDFLISLASEAKTQGKNFITTAFKDLNFPENTFIVVQVVINNKSYSH